MTKIRTRAPLRTIAGVPGVRIRLSKREDCEMQRKAKANHISIAEQYRVMIRLGLAQH